MRIVLVSGGTSDEAAVSRRSGAAVAAALAEHPHQVPVVRVDPAETPLDTFEAEPSDVFLNLLHGSFGEDGGIQRIAAERGWCLTGCDEDAARRTFDKALARRCLKDADVPHAAGYVAEPDAPLPSEIAYPLVVKPSCSGSSVGLSLVERPAQWAAAIRLATANTKPNPQCTEAHAAIVEEYLRGPEWSVTLLGREPLPPICVETPHRLFDATAKYASDSSTFTPIPLDRADAADLCELAVAAAEACGTRGLVRVDLRSSSFASPPDRGAVRVLEINTVPGMTERSLSPLAAMAAGMSLGELAWWMIDDARGRPQPIDAGLSATGSS